MVEEFASRGAKMVCDPLTLPSSEESSRAFAARCMDAYLAAVWTDAHATFLQNRVSANATIEAHMDSPLSEQKQFAFGQPYVRGTISISACPNVSDHLNRSLHGWTPKSSELREFLGILVKSNQSGSRGWEAIVKSMAKVSASKEVFSKAFLASCVGMHPNVHPAARPRWDERLLILSVLKPVLRTSFQTVFEGCHYAAKEALRIYTAVLMDDVCATKQALLISGHPMGVFHSSSNCLANASVHAAAQMTVAGARAAAREIATLTNARSSLSPGMVCVAMQAAFADARPPRLAFGRNATQNAATRSCKGSDAKQILYSSSWASRIAFYARPKKTCEGVNAMDLGGEMLIRCFKVEFIPFWIHGHSHNARVGRMDASQKQSLHSDACGRQMTDFLSRIDVLKLIRMVWSCPVERFLSADEVFEKLGADADLCARMRQKTTIDEAIEAVTSFEAVHVAKFLTFCKLVSIKHKFFSYDLGEETKRLQLLALRKRFNVGPDVPDDGVVAVLPDHAKKLHYCLECNKTSNACVVSLAKPQLHDELGIAQTMLRVGAVGEEEHVRCAKRSSAAYRTAIAKEQSAKSNRVELKDVTMESLKHGFRDNGDSSHLQRLRRDLYTCAEQLDHATGCGDSPVVLIPIFGKAIRVAGKWLTMCSFCAAITRVDPARRFGGHVCCRRCDPAMLGGTRPTQSEERKGLFDHLEVEKNCRFCDKKPPLQAVSKFVLYRTPSDESGRNGAIPKPLRTAFYCASHSRPWLATAHKNEMDMRIIFAHILNRATPVWGADETKDKDEMTEAAETAKRKRQTIDRRFRKLQRSTTVR
jgi:hypothetical protein